MTDDRRRVIPSLLGMLKDVLISAMPTDGYALVWNAAAKKWEPGAVFTADQLVGFHDEFTAAATPATTYTLGYVPRLGTCLMALNGHVQREGVDYTCNYTTGVVTVAATQASGDKLTFRYLISAGNNAPLSSTTGSGTGTGTFAAPSASTAGDLLVACVWSLDTVHPTLSGWTNQQGGSSTFVGDCFTKTAAGGAETITVNNVGTGKDWIGICVRVPQGNAYHIFDLAGGTLGASASSLTIASVTGSTSSGATLYAWAEHKSASGTDDLSHDADISIQTVSGSTVHNSSTLAAIAGYKPRNATNSDAVVASSPVSGDWRGFAVLLK